MQNVVITVDTSGRRTGSSGVKDRFFRPRFARITSKCVPPVEYDASNDRYIARPGSAMAIAPSGFESFADVALCPGKLFTALCGSGCEIEVFNMSCKAICRNQLVRLTMIKGCWHAVALDQCDCPEATLLEGGEAGQTVPAIIHWCGDEKLDPTNCDCSRRADILLCEVAEAMDRIVIRQQCHGCDTEICQFEMKEFAKEMPDCCDGCPPTIAANGDSTTEIDTNTAFGPAPTVDPNIDPIGWDFRCRSSCIPNDFALTGDDLADMPSQFQLEKPVVTTSTGCPPSIRSLSTVECLIRRNDLGGTEECMRFRFTCTVGGQVVQRDNGTCFWELSYRLQWTRILSIDGVQDDTIVSVNACNLLRKEIDTRAACPQRFNINECISGFSFVPAPQVLQVQGVVNPLESGWTVAHFDTLQQGNGVPSCLDPDGPVQVGQQLADGSASVFNWMLPDINAICIDWQF